MRAAVYHGNRDIRLEEVERGDVDATSVRISVAACGICGTDLHEYVAGPIDTPESEPHPITGQRVPLRMGHEFGGTVEEVGRNVSDIEVGDVVAVNPLLTCGECKYCHEGHYNICKNIGTIGLSGNGGGFAESAIVDESHVVKMPDGVPREYTALVEPLAVGYHAVQRSGMEFGNDIAVIGCGPIGLATILAAKSKGANRIFASASRSGRREIASQIGADEVINPHETDPVKFIRSQTGEGVDVAFEAAGSSSSFDQAIQSTTRNGDITVISLFEDQIEVNPNPLVHGERTLHGVFGYQTGPFSKQDYLTVVEHLADNRIDPSPLITGRIGLDGIVEEGFEALLDRSNKHVKILVEP